MKKLYRFIFRSRLTLIGTIIAIVALCIFVFLSIMEMLDSESHPYVGIITFVVLPVILNLGIILVIIGSIRTARRARRGELEEPAIAPIDLNSPKHLRSLLVLTIGGFVFLILSAFGSFQAYEAMESVEFCGQACHKVMKPEFVTYQVSPHAKVACVACHIGPGAGPFVQSKVSGSYQLYSVLFNKYSRPIKTPIHNLRPAKETCQECHWPEHFFNSKLQTKTYFASDEKNTQSKVNLLMKIGGGDPEHGAADGIHSHMYIDRDIYYVATDRQRLVIPYVESRGKDGKVRTFRSKETPITDAQIKKSEKRIMDCIECHNRPSHRFPHPAESVNQALALGNIDSGLPEIKRLAVEVLEKPYKTEAEASAGISKEIAAYYQKDYPQVSKSSKNRIDAAISQVQKIYSVSYFPEMRSSWKAYPDHISHMYSPGCFRCHDNKHVSDDGKVLTNECSTCHTIVSQTGRDGTKQESMDGVPFRHPEDVGDAWKESLCSDCHAPKEE